MSIFILISILLIGAMATAIVFVGLSALDERDRFKQTMKRAQGEIPHDEREENLTKSFVERVFRPIAGSLVPFLKSITPPGYIERVRIKMIRSGKPDHEAVDKFLAGRLLSLALIPVLAVIFFVFRPGEELLGSTLALVVWILTLVVVLVAPDVSLTRKVDSRRALMQQQLPDILDLLTISVEAGLGFEQAVDRVVSNVPGPFSEELNRMLGESRSGMSRAEALRALDQRVDLPDVKSFVMAILQADKFGVPIGRVLRMQSDEMRVKRRQIAQEKAQKAPVKILIPTVVCIFPVLFIVVLGPAVIRIIQKI
jgi:tight adherence protein C